MSSEAGDGQIALCSTAGCGRCCCDFSGGNYIVLYPGELNEAVAEGRSIAHLEVRPSSDGGHRAICHAGDTAICDGGYKPLDCASYPFFPEIDADGAVQMTRFGRKCPLLPDALGTHTSWAAVRWRRLCESSQAVGGWIKRVALVGYTRSCGSNSKHS